MKYCLPVFFYCSVVATTLPFGFEYGETCSKYKIVPEITETCIIWLYEILPLIHLDINADSLRKCKKEGCYLEHIDNNVGAHIQDLKMAIIDGFEKYPDSAFCKKIALLAKDRQIDFDDYIATMHAFFRSDWRLREIYKYISDNQCMFFEGHPMFSESRIIALIKTYSKFDSRNLYDTFTFQQTIERSQVIVGYLLTNPKTFMNGGFQRFINGILVEIDAADRYYSEKFSKLVFYSIGIPERMDKEKLNKKCLNDKKMTRFYNSFVFLTTFYCSKMLEEIIPLMDEYEFILSERQFITTFALYANVFDIPPKYDSFLFLLTCFRISRVPFDFDAFVKPFIIKTIEAIEATEWFPLHSTIREPETMKEIVNTCIMCLSVAPNPKKLHEDSFISLTEFGEMATIIDEYVIDRLLEYSRTDSHTEIVGSMVKSLLLYVDSLPEKNTGTFKYVLSFSKLWYEIYQIQGGRFDDICRKWNMQLGRCPNASVDSAIWPRSSDSWKTVENIPASNRTKSDNGSYSRADINLLLMDMKTRIAVMPKITDGSKNLEECRDYYVDKVYIKFIKDKNVTEKIDDKRNSVTNVNNDINDSKTDVTVKNEFNITNSENDTVKTDTGFLQPKSKDGPDSDNDIVERIETNIKRQITERAADTTECTDSKGIDDLNDFVVVDSDTDKSNEDASDEIEVIRLKE